MGQKRTAKEYFEMAKANGWENGAHEEEDCVVLEQDKPSKIQTESAGGLGSVHNVDLQVQLTNSESPPSLFTTADELSKPSS
jgi:hypothetical protein